MIEFILSNQNWFYLLGVVFIISRIHSIIVRAKNKPKKNVTFDYNDLESSKKEIKKLSSKFDSVLFIFSLSWIIYGFWHPEKIYFIFILITSHIIPTLASLGELGTVKEMIQDNGGKINSNDIKERIDMNKYRKFFSFLDVVEIFAVIIIMISHFKIALFYLLAV